MIEKPGLHEYDSFFARYIVYLDNEDILKALEAQITIMQQAFTGLSSEQQHYRYAPEKWTVLEVLGHIVDTERVLGIRAFCFARGESASLPGMDEQAYAREANHNQRTMQSLLEEYMHIRKGNLLMFRPLTADSWQRTGTANNSPLSVRALAFIMVGHIRHHLTILSTHYGLPI